MKEKIKSLILAVSEKIEDDIRASRHFHEILDAYNAYQEDERDGVDYIFNITEQEDLVCCVKGGLTAEEIVSIMAKGEIYFFFGCNHVIPSTITACDLENILMDSAYEIAKQVILYCGRSEKYSVLYEFYVTDTMVG